MCLVPSLRLAIRVAYPFTIVRSDLANPALGSLNRTTRGNSPDTSPCVYVVTVPDGAVRSPVTCCCPLAGARLSEISPPSRQM